MRSDLFNLMGVAGLQLFALQLHLFLDSGHNGF